MNTFSSKSLLFSVSVTATMMATAGAAQALTVVPTDLNPGDPYRLVFVTEDTVNAGPNGIGTNISSYNFSVTLDVIGPGGSQLDTDLAAAGFDVTGIQYSVIGSTETVDAIDNTMTTGTGVPIYLVTGERVANNYLDLWDGTILTAINTTTDGNTYTGQVWTGTSSTGFANEGLPGVKQQNLGDSFVVIGSSSVVDGNWIDLESALDTGTPGVPTLRPLYGISSVLEVPTTPEPSSLLGFITLGGLMLGAAVRRAKQS